MNYPYMPKSTALWLIENTALTFEQIGDFCGLHELEVKNIADAESNKMQGLNPVINGQITKEDIERCEKDPSARLVLQDSIVKAQEIQKKGKDYMPKLYRQNRLGGISWIIKNYPDLSDGQIAKLMRSTNKTVNAIRTRKHPSISLIKLQNPITLGLVTNTSIQDALAKAHKKAK